MSVAWCFTISNNNTGNYHYNHQQTAFGLGFTIIITEVTQTPAKTVQTPVVIGLWEWPSIYFSLSKCEPQARTPLVLQMDRFCISPFSTVCILNITKLGSGSSGDTIAVQNHWQDIDKVADWLQVGSPTHLNRLDEALKEPMLLIRKPSDQIKTCEWMRKKKICKSVDHFQLPVNNSLIMCLLFDSFMWNPWICAQV